LNISYDINPANLGPDDFSCLDKDPGPGKYPGPGKFPGPDKGPGPVDGTSVVPASWGEFEFEQFEFDDESLS
jgi:hypothetical protein